MVSCSAEQHTHSPLRPRCIQHVAQLSNHALLAHPLLPYFCKHLVSERATREPPACQGGHRAVAQVPQTAMLHPNTLDVCCLRCCCCCCCCCFGMKVSIQKVPQGWLAMNTTEVPHVISAWSGNPGRVGGQKRTTMHLQTAAGKENNGPIYLCRSNETSKRSCSAATPTGLSCTIQLWIQFSSATQHCIALAVALRQYYGTRRVLEVRASIEVTSTILVTTEVSSLWKSATQPLPSSASPGTVPPPAAPPHARHCAIETGYGVFTGNCTQDQRNRVCVGRRAIV
jgi:hypothetical protein